MESAAREGRVTIAHFVDKEDFDQLDKISKFLSFLGYSVSYRKTSDGLMATFTISWELPKMKDLAKTIAEAVKQGYEVHFRRATHLPDSITISVLDRPKNMAHDYHVDLEAVERLNTDIGGLNFVLYSAIKSSIEKLKEVEKK
jgi:regulator of RNase E activity RraB